MSLFHTNSNNHFGAKKFITKLDQISGQRFPAVSLQLARRTSQAQLDCTVNLTLTVSQFLDDAPQSEMFLCDHALKEEQEST